MTGPAGPGPAAWPEARLDRLGRLRALAAGLPGTVLQERVIDAPFADVWGFVGEFEASVPAFDRDVARLRIVRRAGPHLRIHAWMPGVPLPLPFDVTVGPGWCWMVSDPHVYVVGMAAEPAGGGTRFGHLEGFIVCGPRPVQTLAGPLLRLSRWRHARHVARDLDGIERCVAARLQGPGKRGLPPQ